MEKQHLWTRLKLLIQKSQIDVSEASHVWFQESCF